jgi:ABC-2 type transport system permease protein
MTATAATADTTDIRRNRGRLGLLALQVRTEVVAARRNVEYVVGVIAIPTILYTMFGMPNDSTFVPGGATFGTLAVGSYGAFGVVSLALFTFGDEVAKERGRGWLRTLRATPVLPYAYLVGKLSMAAVYTVLIVAALAAVSIPTGAADLPVTAWLALTAILVAGVLALSTLGLAIAFLVRPRAATATAYLVFLPLAFCSGFFVPLSEVPAVLRDVAPFLPTYHLGRLVWPVVGSEADIAALTGIDPQPTAVHLAWVLGCTVAGAVIALLAARRTAVTRR